MNLQDLPGDILSLLWDELDDNDIRSVVRVSRFMYDAGMTSLIKNLPLTHPVLPPPKILLDLFEQKPYLPAYVRSISFGCWDGLGSGNEQLWTRFASALRLMTDLRMVTIHKPESILGGNVGIGEALQSHRQIGSIVFRGGISPIGPITIKWMRGLRSPLQALKTPSWPARFSFLGAIQPLASTLTSLDIANTGFSDLDQPPVPQFLSVSLLRLTNVQIDTNALAWVFPNVRSVYATRFKSISEEPGPHWESLGLLHVCNLSDMCMGLPVSDCKITHLIIKQPLTPLDLTTLSIADPVILEIIVSSGHVLALHTSRYFANPTSRLQALSLQIVFNLSPENTDDRSVGDTLVSFIPRVESNL